MQSLTSLITSHVKRLICVLGFYLFFCPPFKRRVSPQKDRGIAAASSFRFALKPASKAKQEEEEAGVTLLFFVLNVSASPGCLEKALIKSLLLLEFNSGKYHRIQCKNKKKNWEISFLIHVSSFSLKMRFGLFEAADLHQVNMKNATQTHSFILSKHSFHAVPPPKKKQTETCQSRLKGCFSLGKVSG